MFERGQLASCRGLVGPGVHGMSDSFPVDAGRTVGGGSLELYFRSPNLLSVVGPIVIARNTVDSPLGLSELVTAAAVDGFFQYVSRIFMFERILESALCPPSWRDPFEPARRGACPPS